MNNSRKLSKQRDKNIAEAKHKKQSRIKRDNLLTDAITSGILLVYLLGLILYSVITQSDNLGFTLAILSLIITMCFELYEWIYLFKKDKSKKHSLLPCAFSASIFMIFILLTVILNYKITNFKWNDLICSGTLFLYIILITIRKMIEDYKN